MLFVCHPTILHKHCLQFLLGVKMAPRETENNAYAKFWDDNKEHYGMFSYFLEWSIAQAASFSGKYTIDQPRFQSNIPSNRCYIARISQIW